MLVLIELAMWLLIWKMFAFEVAMRVIERINAFWCYDKMRVSFELAMCQFYVYVSLEVAMC